MPHWMERHCGRDASPELCALMPAMPHDSQVVLWGRAASPLDSRINRVAGKAEIMGLGRSPFAGRVLRG